MITLNESASLTSTSFKDSNNGTPVFGADGKMNEDLAMQFVSNLGAKAIKTIPSHNIVVVTMDKRTKAIFQNNADVSTYLMISSSLDGTKHALRYPYGSGESTVSKRHKCA